MKKIKSILKLLTFAVCTSSASASTISIEKLNADSDVAIKLYVLDCGRVLTRDLSIFNPNIDKGIAMDMVVPCYVIRHPTKGVLVWDAGLNDKLINKPDGEEYYQGAFNLSVKKTMRSQLAELGLSADNITYFAPSHLHVDHSGNANFFKQSTLLIQQPEYQIAFSKEAKNYGFNLSTYSELKEAKRIELHGDHDVFNDGSVIILSTPGHSPGHQSLYIKLPKTGPVILSGDLYHFEKNRRNYGIPIWNDKKLTINSFAKVDAILDQTSAELWIQHDPQQGGKTKKSPLYYQ